MDYQSSGVNIEAGNQAVENIKSMVAATHSAQVLGGLGGFAAAYDIGALNYKHPILVSCTDGVGTKLSIAIQHQRLQSVGIDLVAMSVNDLLCTGAKPLFFLDYYACESLNPQQVKAVIKGICDGCRLSGCSLIGGEMAEMGNMYKKNDFDLAGFACGIVEKDRFLDGKAIQKGDKIYAIPSHGFHSNGYSLIRKVLEKNPEAKNVLSPEVLLKPTRIYTDVCESLLKKHPEIHAFAHITGGGLHENITRLLAPDCQLNINFSAVRVLDCFKQLQILGNISDQEMWKVFNMGVGMVVISPTEITESEDCYLIGSIT